MIPIVPATPSPLLAPPVGPLEGAAREGLHSAFRRICEKNQLTVSDVLSGVILPLLGAPVARLTKMSSAVHLLNRGGTESSRLIEQLQTLTTLKDLSRLTLGELVSLRGVGVMATTRHRKWCGECLNNDLDTELGPYERLLWSIDDVQACPVHTEKLQSICPCCGGGPFAMLTGRDISGRCPRCLGWLGVGRIALNPSRDEHSRFLIWVAKSYSDLLESPLPAETDVRPGITRIIQALAVRHYDGVLAQFASGIERNRSVVGTWLAGRASPSWEALCEISFVFQVPLQNLLTGEMDSVEFSMPQRLPFAALERLASPRKLPEHRNIEEIRLFLARVERGELPAVLSLGEAAKRLGIDRSNLSRLVPTEYARLSPILADRRSILRERKKAAREKAMRVEVPEVVGKLLRSGKRATRRAVDYELARTGLPVRRQDAPFVRQLVQLAVGDKTAELVSGIK